MREKFILPTFSRSVNQLKDLDGNVYTVVTIGTQEWIVENWRCTKYADGSAIPNLQESEFNDWFLPSRQESNDLYTNRVFLGMTGIYWSSSEASASDAYMVNYDTGVFSAVSKENVYKVRPIRRYISSKAYNLLSIGEIGIIINKVDNGDSTFTYTEAYTEDLTNSIYSDDIYELAGATTSDGQVNTLLIIESTYHTTSAAKLCNDLSIGGGWINDTDGAYCAYDNDTDNIASYGLLYNWFAVDNVKGLAYLERNGVQELGWGVPTDAEWTTLTNYLGGEAIAGGKLKESGLEHWIAPNIGATNESGFTARAGGRRLSETGAFDGIELYIILWSSSEGSASSSYSRTILYSDEIVERNNYNKKHGFSIRLVRDVS